MTEITDIEKVVNKNFPNLLEETKVCLSVISALLIEDVTNPIGLNLVGSPSGGKTTVLSFCYRLPMTFKTNNVTSKAFVSCANKSEEDLKKIDLLPKIKNKCIIVPELAPLFHKRADDLIEELAALTAIFDGDGFERDSGMSGHRGYSERHMFTWLGATTPPDNNVWKTMGNLGARFFFWNLDEKDKSEDEVLNNVLHDLTYQKKVEECRDVIRPFLENMWERYSTNKIVWDRQRDKELVRRITEAVEVLRRLRATIKVWKVDTEDVGEEAFSYSSPLIEQPERAVTILYNIARGHALIHKRDRLTEDDLPLIYRIAFSSAPYDRTKIFELLIKHNGTLFVEDVKKSLKCSDSTVTRIFKMFEILGLVDHRTAPNHEDSYKPVKYIELKKPFRWVLGLRQNGYFAPNFQKNAII